MLQQSLNAAAEQDQVAPNADNNNTHQQYQNQEEIRAEQQQQLQMRQQQLQQQQQQQMFMEQQGFDAPNSVVPSAPILTEAEMLQLNEANMLHQQQQQQMITEEQRQRYQSHLQLQLNQISAANAMGMQQFLHQAADNMMNIQARQQEPAKYQRNFVDGDFEFVSGFCFRNVK